MSHSVMSNFLQPHWLASLFYLREELLQEEILQWVTISFPGDLPGPGVEPRSPALLADSLEPSPRGQIVKILFSDMAAIQSWWYFKEKLTTGSFF